MGKISIKLFGPYLAGGFKSPTISPNDQSTRINLQHFLGELSPFYDDQVIEDPGIFELSSKTMNRREP